MEAKIESTEDKIIYATIKLLNENGLSNTTTPKIASESDFSEVTIFRKFKNKDNFFKVDKEIYYSSFFEKIGKIFDYRTDDDVKDHITHIWKQIMVLSNNELNMVKIAIDELRDSYSKNKAPLKFADMAINKLFKFLQHQIDNRIHEINPILTYNIFCLIFESIIIWKIYGINLNQIAVESSYLNDFRPVYEWNLNWIYS
jgi:AcrR family transcriptional regulator